MKRCTLRRSRFRSRRVVGFGGGDYVAAQTANKGQQQKCRERAVFHLIMIKNSLGLAVSARVNLLTRANSLRAENLDASFLDLIANT